MDNTKDIITIRFKVFGHAITVKKPREINISIANARQIYTRELKEPFRKRAETRLRYEGMGELPIDKERLAQVEVLSIKKTEVKPTSIFTRF